MKYTGTAVFLLLALAACKDSSADGQKEPETPQEMYDHVQELLKPNTEREGPALAEAMQWLIRAAEGGYLPAMTDLGGIYLEGGKGVKRNGAEALKWFTRAAEQGNKEAYVFMGTILYFGIDMPADPDRAVEYWQKAADAGIPEAHFNLGSALIRFLPTAEDGVKHLEQAANTGKGRVAASAATQLGFIYSKGLGNIPPNNDTAAVWYRAGAEGGNPKAQLVYALMLLSGTHVGKDEKSGMAYLRMSAGQDFPPAIAQLINLLRNSADAQDNEAEIAAWEKRLESLRMEPAE